ncbi:MULTISPECIES: ABC transporter ATP-binding protein [unclassified Herbaspirillum]|uniref:ABC transporter ATP-binding protein n=1 Tax=unclassified Herbaspirillum TaxID=2624150 RepID=UPI00114E4446|nr:MULTISPECIES: ABC transporter ATP-binding protein [unclassified Herbaspirillum]MBB5391295.1 simple sugar transport system ATP-binding protein [Herbaspirillum sp. SJZ102]TQK13018.1 nucleoside ABC transporter ATP-binding protein [Herbaspirillum sp. SJZ130]TQK15022.1 nucleoside ABC transporter ATP-binding protein [Herbaspirillum sp. SJZ106]
MNHSQRVPLLELRHVSKVYPNGTLASDDVCLAIHAGEIHAIVGENGAGKSTVMKMLYGLEQPGSGQLRMQGQELHLPNPAAAIAAGIGLVPQHLQLLPSFSVADNIVLGAEPVRGVCLDRRAAVERVRALSRHFGLQVDPLAKAGSLAIGVQQRVEILKALYRGARILLLDEPTAVLAAQEVHTLFDSLRNMVAQGLTVVLISHKTADICAIADRFTVLRRGRVSGAGSLWDTTPAQLDHMIVGTAPAPLPLRDPGARASVPLVSVRALQAHAHGGHAMGPLSFDIAAGEILGIAGIEGNGQDLLARVLLGQHAAQGGQASVDGRRITGLDVRAVRDCGVAAIAEDRLHDGVAPNMSIADNVIATQYHRRPLSLRGWLDPAAIGAAARQVVERCGVKAASPADLIGTLSGGNMQKVVLGRETASAPRLLIASQPTRGVDIGAARSLQSQLAALCEAGSAVLLISADLDELLSLSDRVAVMAGGELVAHFASRGLAAETLGPYMTGTRRQADAAATLDAPFTPSGVAP